MRFNITLYMQLLAEVYALQDRLRKDPPNDVAEYLALAAEIEGLWNRINALLSEGELDAATLRQLRDQAHAENQAVPVDPLDEGSPV